MTASQWQRVRDLFERALEAPPDDTAAWIAQHAGDDAAVRDELESLLAHHSRAGDFLERPVADMAPDLLADAGALPPHTVLGAYTIVRELGRGGMGCVYAARDERLGRLVALKALGPALAHNTAHRERLRREAQAAAALTHPGICTVYALEEIDGQLFIASELVDGETLRTEMGRGAPPVRAVEDTARELAAALASAHARGITHRDLKPENVMRTRDGRVKILDFGLARVETARAAVAAATIRMTAPGVLLGTPAYMAPEQLNGQPCDARADVFAYGVLMYEYACGEHPFAAPTELAMLARVLESRAHPIAERRPELTLAVCRVIERCLQKAPSGRFASAAEIVEALSPGAAAHVVRRPATWWRVHQLALMLVYIVASSVAWGFKESFPSAAALWIFIGIGGASAMGGVLRGHLLFTESMNRPRLAVERRRASGALAAADALVAIGLALDALLIASLRPLWTVLTIGLAVGVALAALLMEPATTAAVFGEEA